MRNYGKATKPEPKNEHHGCRCGAKFKTVTALESHVKKLKVREIAGWEPEGSHDIHTLLKNGTLYYYG